MTSPQPAPALRALVLLIVAGTVVTGAVVGRPSRSAAAPDPIGRPPAAVPGRYVVTLRPSTTPDIAQAAATLARAHRGHLEHVYERALHGFAVTMTETEARDLADDPRVASVDQDATVTIAGTQSPAPWALDRLDQPDLPLDNRFTAPWRGSAVHAYVIDTGIRTTHTDFAGRATTGIDLVGDGRDGQDCNGHGTFVAGLLGGSDYGVAKGTALVSVRVLDCQGTATMSDAIAAVDWVTAHAVKPAVANMSFGGPAYPPLDDAVSNSIASGIVYSAAAGNDGVDACDDSPARVDGALTTGASDVTDHRAAFSNYGTCLKLFAPGVAVQSDSNASDTAVASSSGTSMASPVVGGLAALVLDRFPALTPAAVVDVVTGATVSDHVVDAGPGSPNRLAQVPPAPSAHPGVVILAVGDETTADIMDAVLATDPASPDHDPNNYNLHAAG